MPYIMSIMDGNDDLDIFIGASTDRCLVVEISEDEEILFRKKFSKEETNQLLEILIDPNSLIELE